MKKLFLKIGAATLTALVACGSMAACTPTETPKTITGVSAQNATVLTDRSVSLQICNLQAGDKVLYSADNQTFGETLVSFTRAGTYTLYYKIVREGFQDFVSSAQIEVVAPQDLFSVDGNTLTFGKYPSSILSQSGAGAYETVTATPYESVTLNGVNVVNGGEYRFAVEDVLWTVVETTEKGYVAVSQEIVDAAPYHSAFGATSYESASVKAKVDTIYNAMFSELERQICSVSLIDAEFVSEYTDVAPAKASDLAIARGCWVSDLTGYVGNGAYWLKDLAVNAGYAKFVDFNGLTNDDGYMVNDPSYGIRLVIEIEF